MKVVEKKEEEGKQNGWMIQDEGQRRCGGRGNLINMIIVICGRKTRS